MFPNATVSIFLIFTPRSTHWVRPFDSKTNKNKREVVEIYHLGWAQIPKYVSFCKIFNKITYISNSSLSIWSGLSTWQFNWKKKWVFAFGFVLLLLGRKLHIIIFWPSSLLSDYGLGRGAGVGGGEGQREGCAASTSFSLGGEGSLTWYFNSLLETPAFYKNLSKPGRRGWEKFPPAKLL